MKVASCVVWIEHWIFKLFARLALCLGLCALQCAKNSEGQHSKVLGLVKQERFVQIG